MALLSCGLIISACSGNQVAENQSSKEEPTSSVLPSSQPVSSNPTSGSTSIVPSSSSSSAIPSSSSSSVVPTSSSSSSSSSQATINMSDSYATAREQFKHVTGIEVPAIANLEADIEYFQFYKETDTEYCFDIISGSALNFQTYMVFENFFKEKLGNCVEGYPDGDETNGRDAEWIKEGRWYQTYWDATNKAIYINTTLRNDDSVLNLAGKTFVGTDVSEKDFVYYESTKEVVKATTLVFASDGTFEMTVTKRASGSYVEDGITLEKGTYQQTENAFAITIVSVKFADQDWMDMPEAYRTASNGTIEGNDILLETRIMDDNNQMVTIHMVLTLQF